jgi:hypothetical protein
LTSEKAHEKFHDEIVLNRKILKKNLIRFATKQDLELEELIKLKSEILQFKNGTLEGVYQYLYFASKKKLPSKVISRIENNEILRLTVSSKGDFTLTVCVDRKKVWTEISTGGKIFKFDFLILAASIAKKMEQYLKA